MKDLTMLANDKLMAKGERIEYELSQVNFGGHTHFIVGVSYLGESSVCAVDVKNLALAKAIYSSIVESNTTPIILMDTVYDMLH